LEKGPFPPLRPPLHFTPASSQGFPFADELVFLLLNDALLLSPLRDVFVVFPPPSLAIVVSIGVIDVKTLGFCIQDVCFYAPVFWFFFPSFPLFEDSFFSSCPLVTIVSVIGGTGILWARLACGSRSRVGIVLFVCLAIFVFFSFFWFSARCSY